MHMHALICNCIEWPHGPKPEIRHEALLFSPGACSLAPHIIGREAGIAIDLVKVDLGAHRTEKGEDYFTISPRGYVPAIEIDGERPRSWRWYNISPSRRRSRTCCRPPARWSASA